MPSDSNGVYSLPSAYLVRNGDLIVPGQHNQVFEDVATALTARLSVSGAAPMSGPLKSVGGSAASPGLCFAGAENFGFTKTINGIGVSIAGTIVFEFLPSGILIGARYIGELFPWTGIAPPPLCVLPFGQTLSRTTYASLWAFAQTEIAAGNTFYNSGNGSTTFGIGDLRGRVIAGQDNMGGVAASRLTGDTMAPNAITLGAAGGVEAYALSVVHMPTGIPVAVSGSVSVLSTPTNVLRGTIHDNFTSTAGDAGPIQGVTGNQIASTGSFSGTGTAGGSGQAHSNVQATLITKFALFAGA